MSTSAVPANISLIPPGSPDQRFLPTPELPRTAPPQLIDVQFLRRCLSETSDQGHSKVARILRAEQFLKLLQEAATHLEPTAISERGSDWGWMTELPWLERAAKEGHIDLACVRIFEAGRSGEAPTLLQTSSQSSFSADKKFCLEIINSRGIRTQTVGTAADIAKQLGCEISALSIVTQSIGGVFRVDELNHIKDLSSKNIAPTLYYRARAALDSKAGHSEDISDINKCIDYLTAQVKELRNELGVNPAPEIEQISANFINILENGGPMERFATASCLEVLVKDGLLLTPFQAHMLTQVTETEGLREAAPSAIVHSLLRTMTYCFCNSEEARRHAPYFSETSLVLGEFLRKSVKANPVAPSDMQPTLKVLLRMHAEGIHNCRTFGTGAHVDAGKTTLTERILLAAGKIRQAGTVDDGTTVTDTLTEEKNHGITIRSAAVSFTGRTNIGKMPVEYTLVDTPGHVEFSAEVERCMRALDGAVVLFDAAKGVEAQSRTVWNQTEKYKLGLIAVVNKMDFDHAVPDLTLLSIQEMDDRAVPIQIPIGQGVRFEGVIDLITMEAVYSGPKGSGDKRTDIPDEYLDIARSARTELLMALKEKNVALLEALNYGEVSPALLRSVLRQEVCRGTIVPVLYASAKKDIGVHSILDAVANYLPSPMDLTVDGSLRISPNPDAAKCVLVFGKEVKVTEGKRTELTWLRVLSGRLESGDTLNISGSDDTAHIKSLVQLEGGQAVAISSLGAGQIAAISGQINIGTGDILCADGLELHLAGIEAPLPIVSYTIVPHDPDHREATPSPRLVENLVNALGVMARMDKSFRFTRGGDKSLIVSGTGVFHIQMVRERIQREYGIATKIGTPSVEFRRTISTAVTQHMRHMHGDTHVQLKLAVSPLPRGSGIEIAVDLDLLDPFKQERARAGGDEIPKIISFVRQGLQEGLAGINDKGLPITDIKVVIKWVDYKNASYGFPAAFRQASDILLRKAVTEAGELVLEPFVSYTIKIRTQDLSKVIGQLTDERHRHGKLDGSVPSEVPGFQEIVATMPLLRSFDFAEWIRSNCPDSKCETPTPAGFRRRIT